MNRLALSTAFFRHLGEYLIEEGYRPSPPKPITPDRSLSVSCNVLDINGIGCARLDTKPALSLGIRGDVRKRQFPPSHRHSAFIAEHASAGMRVTSAKRDWGITSV